MSCASIVENMVIYKETVPKPKAPELKTASALTLRNTIHCSGKVNEQFLEAMVFLNLRQKEGLRFPGSISKMAKAATGFRNADPKERFKAGKRP